jgi:hypothetical protein
VGSGGLGWGGAEGGGGLGEVVVVWGLVLCLVGVCGGPGEVQLRGVKHLRPKQQGEGGMRAIVTGAWGLGHQEQK